MSNPTTTPKPQSAARKPAASARYCPRCKRITDYALVVNFIIGRSARAWQCLACGRKHE